jgi:integrase
MSPRYRKPYFLVLRKTRTASVWYYQAYSLDGSLLPPRSTGIGFASDRDRTSSRRKADAYCKSLLASGKLGERAQSSPTLAAWCEDWHWWQWGECRYCASRLARSSADAPAITESYALSAYRILRGSILPAHGKRKLSDISPDDCEKLLFQWAKQTSAKTANNRRSVYSTMLGEAARLRVIERNPWESVPSLSPAKRPHGGLTTDEVKRLLARATWQTVWRGIEPYYVPTLLAFYTGLRIGEVAGLRTEDVRDTYVERDGEQVRFSYLHLAAQHNQMIKKRTLLKDKEPRDIPLLPALRDELDALLKPPGYLFSFTPGRTHPLTPNRLREAFYLALSRVGVSDEERRERRIVFHSTRRYTNTLLRSAGVPDYIIRRITGHAGEAMTERYTDMLVEDARWVDKISGYLE